ncbi:uncharacterized protein BDZ83DRAFT_611012 [Colletotrichum acutatum]|uniref:Uncharacterized protein n=1 Tax=Glomerella acutata TaxID=27357 RepID=A0AAD8XHD4_GLOAC|nr:uncharacterized protein BDZ83DRAFT_611012 [Colletotrichum acutatum]KAK1728054.1 hypothetical protein BDZ83DRAFT_611012 [Colletotrichum acutatum]
MHIPDFRCLMVGRSEKGLGSGSTLDRLALSPLGKGESRKYLPWLVVREGRAEPVGRTLGRGNLGRRLDGRVAKEGTRTARGRMADGVWFGGTLENWLEILVWTRCGWGLLIASAGGQVDLIETWRIMRGGDMKLEQGARRVSHEGNAFHAYLISSSPSWGRTCGLGVPFWNFKSATRGGSFGAVPKETNEVPRIRWLGSGQVGRLCGHGGCRSDVKRGLGR